MLRCIAAAITFFFFLPVIGSVGQYRSRIEISVRMYSFLVAKAQTVRAVNEPPEPAVDASTLAPTFLA